MRFQEKLQHFHVALCFVQIFSPGVKSVAAKQESVDGGISVQEYLDLFSKPRDVLAILENREDFPMLMCAHAPQSLEHLESFERYSAIGRENFG